MTTAKLRELLERATGTPWHTHHHGSDREHVAACNRTEVRSVARIKGDGSEDAALIAAAVNALPALLEVVEAVAYAHENGDELLPKVIRTALAAFEALGS